MLTRDMGKSDQSIIESFHHVRVFLKCAGTFIVAAGGVQVLAGFSPWVEASRQWIFGEGYRLLGIFVAFYALFLVIEVLMRVQRLEMETMRSSPAFNRHERRARESERRRKAKRNG